MTALLLIYGLLTLTFRCLAQSFDPTLVHQNLALGKSAIQSSTYKDAVAERAVDGNSDPNFEYDSCAQTQEQDNPFWRVDLGREFVIESVKITTRNDNHFSKLRNFIIYIGNKGEGTGSGNVKCKDVGEIPKGGSQEIVCNLHISARYVFVTIPRRESLTLCEVKVYQIVFGAINLSYGKQTLQSSTAYDGASDRAVDGNANPDYTAKSCTHTDQEESPWWRVDLGIHSAVSLITITNRDAPNGVRLTNFSIFIGDKEDGGGPGNNLCASKQSIPPGKTRIIGCIGESSGRYVYIRLYNKGEPLSLCEVDVEGRVSDCIKTSLGNKFQRDEIKTPPRGKFTLATFESWSKTQKLVNNETWIVKTAEKGFCQFPFTYKQQERETCVKESGKYICQQQNDRQRMLTCNFPEYLDKDRIGACWLKTINDECCHFPFKTKDKNGKERKHYTCILEGDSEYYCHTVNSKKGYCVFPKVPVDDYEERHYEAFGRYVSMTEVYEYLVQKGHPFTGSIPRNVDYMLRIRADTFICDKKENLPVYSIPGIKELRIIARVILGAGCVMEFPHSQKKPLKDMTFASIGREGDANNPVGGAGLDGLNGEDGGSTKVIISTITAEGSMKITSNGGDGLSGYPGTQGGRGGKGTSGAATAYETNPTCRKHSGAWKKWGYKGGKGGKGGIGGNGGNGGRGGNGGDFEIYIKDKSLGELKLDIEACTGNRGEAGAPGKGGEGGPGGDGGVREYRTETTGFKSRYCSTRTEQLPNGDTGEQGPDGNEGLYGLQGIPGRIKLSDIDKSLYDKATIDIFVRHADDYFKRFESQKASELYNLVQEISLDPFVVKYCKTKVNQIKAGINYFGYSSSYVPAMKVTTISKFVTKAMDNAIFEGSNTDKYLTRYFSEKNQAMNMKAIGEIFKTNNNKAKSGIKDSLLLQKQLRREAVKGIQTIEDWMTKALRDLENYAKDAKFRLVTRKTFDLAKVTLLFESTPSVVSELLEQGYNTISEGTECNAYLSTPEMDNLLKAALQFTAFEDKGQKIYGGIATIDLSSLKGESAASLQALYLRDSAGALKEGFSCLFEAEKMGEKFENAIDTFVDYALTRFQLIGDVYQIDLKMAELKIKEHYLIQRNKAIGFIESKQSFESQGGLVSNKLRLAEDLLDAFRETEKYALETLFIYKESLTFKTLWNFDACFSTYTSAFGEKPLTQNYFIGHFPLVRLRKKLDNYYSEWTRQKSIASTKQGPQEWIKDFKYDKLLKEIQERGSGTFEIKEENFCADGCDNARLSGVYVDVILKDPSKQRNENIVVIFSHLGVNRFHIGNIDQKPIIIKQSKVLSKDIVDNTSEENTRPCSDNTTLCRTTKGKEFLVKLCDDDDDTVVSKRGGNSIPDPCRSLFSRYMISIPISEDTHGLSSNPSYTDTRNIKSIRLLLSITFWKNYVRGGDTCNTS